MECVNNAKTFAKKHCSWIEKTEKLNVPELMDNWKIKTDMDSEPMLCHIRSLMKSGMTPKIENDTVVFSGNMIVALDIDSGELVVSHAKI